MITVVQFWRLRRFSLQQQILCIWCPTHDYSRWIGSAVAASSNNYCFAIYVPCINSHI